MSRSFGQLLNRKSMIKNLIPPYTPGTEGKGGKNQVDDILSIHHNIRLPSAQKIQAQIVLGGMKTLYHGLTKSCCLQKGWIS